MQAVLEVPDDAVAQVKAVLSENRIQNHVERKNLAVLNVVADLPA